MKRATAGSPTRTIVLSAVLGLAVVAMVATGFVLARRGDTVASMDGHDVTRAELIFHMKRLAPTVQNELRNESWDDASLKRLSDAAFDEIWTDKTTFVLADDQAVDYDDLLNEVDAENKHRADAVAKGETVYGVTNFSADEYYTHKLSELRTALQKTVTVTDTDVRRKFDAERDLWSANATTYTYSQLVVPEGSVTAGLRDQVAAAGKLADVTAAGAKLTHATYGGPGATTGVSAHDQDLNAVLGTLDPGEISAPVPGTGQITYYELDGRTVDEDAAFAGYSDRIRRALVEEKFDTTLTSRVQGSDITIDAAAVDAIDAEDVQ